MGRQGIRSALAASRLHICNLCLPPISVQKTPSNFIEVVPHGSIAHSMGSTRSADGDRVVAPCSQHLRRPSKSKAGESEDIKGM